MADQTTAVGRSVFLAKLLLVTIPLLHILGTINYIAHGICHTEGANAFVNPWRSLFSLLAPLFIARGQLVQGSLNRSGALAVVVVGFVLAVTNFCFLAAFYAFLNTGFRAIRFRSNVKEVNEEGYRAAGEKNWMHVVCKTGVAANIAIVFVLEVGCGEFLVDFSKSYVTSALSMSVLGCLATANADTWSSQIGSVIGWGNPRLVTTWEKVPRGTHGAVSILGLLFGTLGGALVGMAYYVVLVMCFTQDALQPSTPQWPVVAVGAATGLAGTLIDSLLGATLQYSGLNEDTGTIVQYPHKKTRDISGTAILDNHGVNMVTSVIMAFLSPTIALAVWAYVV